MEGGNADNTRRLSIGIVVPFHNEEGFLKQALDSWVAQGVRPDCLVLVDDGSTDRGPEIAAGYASEYPWVQYVSSPPEGDTGEPNEALHLPGAKVIEAFYRGFDRVSTMDLIGKFDADIVLPSDYVERMLSAFAEDPLLGACSGLLEIRKNESWVREKVANPDHVRGPVKLYRRECLESIGGLKPQLGWDTADVLLTLYHGFRAYTLPDLRVKHLRPTGAGYSSKTENLRGEALYRMRYDPILAGISALKMGGTSGSWRTALDVYRGYCSAQWNPRVRPFVGVEEGSFIRKYRWKRIRNRLGL